MIQSQWYRPSLTVLTLLLVPLSWVFGIIVSARRFFYQKKNSKLTQFNVPIIVVGNITVGGTGKTPFVIWLAHFLRAQGFQPGIVTRGVGGQRQATPCWVNATSTTDAVGDEAILLQRRSGCPVVVSIDRVAAVQTLLAGKVCNIIISDDGLQHYRLKRDVEIVIVDGVRGFGNGYLLPAGPLREPVKRLETVDFVITNGTFMPIPQIKTSTMELKGDSLVCLADPSQRIILQDFPHKKIHALAAIGNPQRFFTSLRLAGFEVIEHVFPDHYQYKLVDFEMGDDLPVIMTEKDAVKCEKFAKKNHWFLPVTAEIELQLGDALLKKL